MINFKMFKNALSKVFNGENAFKIDRSNKAYAFLSCEYSNYFSKDGHGCFIIPTNEVQNVKPNTMDKIIYRGTDGYSYFSCEYRENALAHDLNGNIILNDTDNVFTKIR